MTLLNLFCYRKTYSVFQNIQYKTFFSSYKTSLTDTMHCAALQESPTHLKQQSTPLKIRLEVTRQTTEKTEPSDFNTDDKADRRRRSRHFQVMAQASHRHNNIGVKKQR